MKTTIVKYPWVYRTLLMIVIIVLGFCFFLFPSAAQDEDTLPVGQFYQNLSFWSRESILAADELEPDHYSYDVPNIVKSDYSYHIEAEELEKLPEKVKYGNMRPNYQGSAYIKKLPKNRKSAIEFPISVPSTQHYDITISVAADKKSVNGLRVGDDLLTNFTVSGTGEFIRVTFYGIFLHSGKTVISIDTIDGAIDVDYLEITNDTSIYDIKFNLQKDPCNPNASEATKELYHTLVSQWGENILTGQYVSDASNRELKLIHEMTGQLPVIRFGELGTDDDLSQIEAAMDWHLYTGGVVGFMWQWNAPHSDSVYTKDSHFSLTKAIYAQDLDTLAKQPLEEIKKLAEDGDIPMNCYYLIRDIDEVSEQLIKLCNMDIPVLWRPLHEASGGWYWWGDSGEISYNGLWKLLFYRMTYYHKLNNLIWIWNGQSTSYLVPANTYDIASVDVYLSPDMTYGSRYEQFLSLSKITGGKKMLALSECSSIPNMEMMLLDHTIWSFYGLWYGDYIMDSSGNFSDQYYSSSDLYNLYNSDHALSLNDFLALCQ